MYMYMHIHVHVHVHVYSAIEKAYACIYMYNVLVQWSRACYILCTDVHVHVYTCMYMYTCTYIHIYMQAPMCIMPQVEITCVAA